MGYRRTDEINTEISWSVNDREYEDIPVCVVYTAKMYADGSGAHSVEVHQVFLDDGRDVFDGLPAAKVAELEEWICGKLERP